MLSEARKAQKRAYAKAKWANDPEFRERRKAFQRARMKNPEFREYKRLYDRVRASGGVQPTRPEPASCELCGRPPGRRRLRLDHCHETKKFRGWLCTQCNTALGKIGDTAEAVHAWYPLAVAYLRKAME